MPFFKISQFGQQCGNVVPDDAPQGVVVDANIYPWISRLRVATMSRHGICGLTTINKKPRIYGDFEGY
jgi:hypothetical protein